MHDPTPRPPHPAPRPLPNSVDEMLARIDALGFTPEWFARTAPLTPAELQRALDDPALPNVPECSTLHHLASSAKRTHLPKWQSQPSDQGIPPAPDLTPRQDHAARLLVAGHSVSSAARLLGVERHTLHRWKKLPAFQRQLHRLLEAL